MTIDAGLPIIMTMIENTPIPVMVDTGGYEELLLTPERLSTLNVTYTGRRRWSVGGLGLLSLSSAREFIVPHMEIGDLSLANVRGLEFHFNRLGQGDQPPPAMEHGVVGLGLLHDFQVIFDYARGRLVLTGDSQYPPDYAPETWTQCRLDVSDLNVGLCGVVQLNGRPLRCVWDTGASFSLIRPGLAAPTDVARRGKHEIAQFATLTVGNVDCGPFEAVLMDFKQPPVDVIMGHSFFEDHTVLVDCAGALLAFD